MNHDSARLAIDALFEGKGRKRAELRAHLDGCLDCRAVYDRTARAFRGLSGRPEEMTPEELWLFEPELPEVAPARSRVWAFLYGGAASIAAIALLVTVRAAPLEFAARGHENPAATPKARAFCARDGASPIEAAQGQCAPGDRLVFAVTGQSRPYAAVAIVDAEDKTEALVSGAQGALPKGEAETVLASGASWRAGTRAVVVFSSTPIEPADAERCVRGECASTLEVAPVPLSPPRSP